MFILYDILGKLKNEFAHSRKGAERGIWFLYTIIAIIIPFTSSKTSNIFRCLKTLFGFTGVRKKRFYTFMASPIREEGTNIRHFDGLRLYPKISCPVLIPRAPKGILTKNDVALPEDVVETMVRNIPDAERVDVEGTNHYSILFQANESRDRAIRNFLEKP